MKTRKAIITFAVISFISIFLFAGSTLLLLKPDITEAISNVVEHKEIEQALQQKSDASLPMFSPLEIPQNMANNIYEHRATVHINELVDYPLDAEPKMDKNHGSRFVSMSRLIAYGKPATLITSTGERTITNTDGKAVPAKTMQIVGSPDVVIASDIANRFVQPLFNDLDKWMEKSQSSVLVEIRCDYNQGNTSNNPDAITISLYSMADMGYTINMMYSLKN